MITSLLAATDGGELRDVLVMVMLVTIMVAALARKWRWRLRAGRCRRVEAAYRRDPKAAAERFGHADFAAWKHAHPDDEIAGGVEPLVLDPGRGGRGTT
ncbi:MAG: hypothetical protein HKO59_09150 [Phycisphaerales bacterium]|nr:hypothetical protein [Phycisphaerae bacterium]NNF43207.1 hypothetical protein [Phycisphaerales bacterium]NNM26136.1 hypothetical protein [Phycisphaerales bacterium]